MTVFLLLLIKLVILCNDVKAQNESCEDRLSKAEGYYRVGKFKYIINEIPGCFNIKKKMINDSAIITSHRYKGLIKDLVGIEKDKAYLLGDYKNFSKKLTADAKTKEERETLYESQYFNYNQRQRAYFLMGKTYYQIGVPEASRLFLRKNLKESPPNISPSIEEIGFNSLYTEQKMNLKAFSVGAVLGWVYTWPVMVSNNRDESITYKRSVSGGNLLLGWHVTYHINNAWSIGLNNWNQASEVVYYRKINNLDSEFGLLVDENYEWIKFPILATWSLKDKFYLFGKNDDLKARFYLQTGLSVNFLIEANATIVVPEQEIYLTNIDTKENKNTVNYDYLFGGGIEFQVYRNFFSISLNGGISLKPLGKSSVLNTQGSNIYKDYGVIENNYHSFIGFWTFKYSRYFGFF